MTLQEQKALALKSYKLAKAKYLEDPSKVNWITFCDCKRKCKLLGVII